MKRWMQRLALALILGGAKASEASAQEPPLVLGAAPAAPTTVMVSSAAAPVATSVDTHPAPSAAGERRRPLWNLLQRKRSCAAVAAGSSTRDFLNRHGYGCGADPSLPSCSSLREDLRFIFGSCRSFFGEPCLPQQPRSSLVDH